MILSKSHFEKVRYISVFWFAIDIDRYRQIDILYYIYIYIWHDIHNT